MNYSYQIYGYVGRHKTTWKTTVYYTYKAVDGTRQEAAVWCEGYSKRTKYEWKQVIEEKQKREKVFVTEIKRTSYED